MKNVIVYSKPNCVQCDMTKRALTKMNVEFETEDLTAPKNAEKMQEFIAKGLRSAPITVIDGEYISGFDPIALQKALA